MSGAKVNIPNKKIVEALAVAGVQLPAGAPAPSYYKTSDTIVHAKDYGKLTMPAARS